MSILRNIRELWEVNRDHFRKKRRNKRASRHIEAPYELHRRICKDHIPTFVLSPGRSGTKTLTQLFAEGESIDVHHRPFPELTHHSRQAYEEGGDRFDSFRNGVDMARYELIRDAHLLGRTYVETNNRITFFAPHLADLFPRSRFIHLLRRPEPFVKSGLARGWYTRNSVQEEGRIHPGDDDEFWSTYRDSSKIAWLWQATHSFIETFKKDPALEGRVMTLRSEDLFNSSDRVEDLFRFIGHAPPSTRKVQKILNSPTNTQKKGKRELTQEEKEAIRKIAELRENYYPEDQR